MSWSSGRALNTLALVTGVAIVVSFITPQSATALEATETSYIIQVPEGQQTELLDTLSQLGVSPDFVYANALTGVAVSLNPSELSTVSSLVSGDIVVPDLPVELMTAQAPAPWNLAMLDSATRPADAAFVYPNSAGAGVRVYVIDTGVAANNPQLAGRILSGTSYVDGDTSTGDCNGHGTHVTGTIASSAYGVAKSAYIVPIRVFDCNGTGGTVSKILDGIDWAIANKPVGTVGVINMSLGVRCSTYCSTLFVNAVQKAVDSNFVVVVSAGNSGTDACTFAPAAAPTALTVGAIDQYDQESSWSNFGSCVDLYAPGVNVVSLNYADSSGAATMSGTSMSSPHVAGAAALYIAANPGISATSVALAIKSGASTRGFSHVASHVGSPNAQLNISNMNANATVGVAPSAPTRLTAKASSMTAIDLNWQPASSYTALTDYIVSYRPVGNTTWVSQTSTPSLATTERVGGLLRDTSYEFRVLAKTDVEGPASTIVLARTMSGIPSKPSLPTSSGVASTTLSLSWATVSGDGLPVTDYDLTYRLSGTGPWVTFVDGVSATSSSLVTGLSPAKSYEFRVRGKTTLGIGPWSNSLVVSTLSGVPSAVQNVSASSISPTSLAIVWSAAVVNGSPVQDYIVEFKRSNDVSWQTWNDGVSPLLSTTITGLTPGTSYSVRVSAKSQFGTGPSSLAPASITTTGRPIKVASLTVQQATSSATLSWAAASANGSPVTDYFIDYRPANVTSWSRFPDGVSVSTRATVTGLTPNVTYYFRVIAVSAFGTSTGTVTTVRTLS
jgi:subtilisin family serine protease